MVSCLFFYDKRKCSARWQTQKPLSILPKRIAKCILNTISTEYLQFSISLLRAAMYPKVVQLSLFAKGKVHLDSNGRVHGSNWQVLPYFCKACQLLFELDIIYLQKHLAGFVLSIICADNTKTQTRTGFSHLFPKLGLADCSSKCNASVTSHQALQKLGSELKSFLNASIKPSRFNMLCRWSMFH